MLAWDDPDVPAASLHEPLVARLDEQQGVSPFVVDYRGIHLERSVIAGWFKFHCLLVEALRTTLRALFALHEVYYPGDTWLRQAILRFGLDAEVLTCFDHLLEAQRSGA